MVSPIPPGRAAAATIAARGRPAARSAPAIFERGPATIPLDRVQDSLPGPLRAIPVQALLAGSGLAAIGVMVFALVLLRSDKAIAALEEDAPASAPSGPTSRAGTTATAAARAPVLTAAELEAARTGGVEALAGLARRFPDDPGVLQALGVAQVREKKDLAGAVRALRRLLEVAPDTRADKDVQAALVDLANGPPDVAADAFEILKTRMGASGPELIFDLAQAGTGKYAKDHAGPALDEPALMKSASKALLVADELRRKTPCARKGLIARASAEGDGRSLPYLRPLAATKPCGGLTSYFRASECSSLPCITPADRAAFAASVAAIEKRDPSAPRAPAASASASAPPATGGGSSLR